MSPIFIIITTYYSYCDLSHLNRVMAQLLAFNDFKQYGQLLAKLGGVAISQGMDLVNNFSQGIKQENGKDFSDAGSAAGKLFSQVLDATFWEQHVNLEMTWEPFAMTNSRYNWEHLSIVAQNQFHYRMSHKVYPTLSLCYYSLLRDPL